MTSDGRRDCLWVGDARTFCHPEKSSVYTKGAVPSVDVSISKT